MEKFINIFDKYTIKARLLPTFIMILPIIMLLFYSYDKYNYVFIFIMFIFVIILTYAFSYHVRERGKKIEIKQKNIWGGLPTTILLRHRSNFLKTDDYHKLFKSNFNITLPSIEEEEENPENADQQYETAITLLKEKTRKNEILLNENIDYGFIRNCLGIKTLSLSISTIVFLIFILMYYFDSKTIIINNNALLFIIILISLILWWVFTISKKRLKTSAYNYAKQLLNCLYDI